MTDDIAMDAVIAIIAFGIPFMMVEIVANGLGEFKHIPAIVAGAIVVAAAFGRLSVNVDWRKW